jgi:histidinol-phosphate aminotransferase
VKENVQLIIRERERVYRGLKVIRGIEAFPSDANFILFRVKDADKVFGELIKRGVLIRNFNSPGRLENCLRVTIGTPEENDEFLSALGDVVS